MLRPTTPALDLDLPLALAAWTPSATLQPTRLLLSRLGPADAVEQTLAGSAEEQAQWAP